MFAASPAGATGWLSPKGKRRGGVRGLIVLFLRAVTSAGMRTRMGRTGRRGGETALENSTYRRHSNGSHDQGRFSTHGAGRGVSAPAITACARQHETRRNEARQEARRQSNARRQGKDAGDG